MRRLVVAPLAASIAALTLATGSVLADPAGSKGALIGTADCGDAGTYSFVVGGGQGEGNGTAWSPAFLEGENGRALFQPTRQLLTFETPFGSFSADETKGGPAGNVTCVVEGQAVNASYSFSGTVEGFLVQRG